MALFTDGPVSDITDLAAQDTQLLNVASVEGIDVTQKLLLAQNELSMELDGLLDGAGSTGWEVCGSGQIDLGRVVVTPALKLWHTYRALEIVYRDAYSSQLNDRYSAKRDQFAERARWAYEKLVQLGIGMCRYPVPQAAVPMMGGVPGGLANGTYYVTMAWVNDAGEEGAPAKMTAFTTLASSFLVQPSAPPTFARAWNVYVGASPEDMAIQNESPIAVQDPWLQPDTLVTGGRGPGCGQSPNYTKPVPRRILRG